VVVGVSVVAIAAVVTGVTVVRGLVPVEVSVGVTAVVDVTVVAVVVASELPPHPETTNKNVRTTERFLTIPVCHPSPEGGGVRYQPQMSACGTATGGLHKCRKGDLNVPDQVLWCHLPIVPGGCDIRRDLKSRPSIPQIDAPKPLTCANAPKPPLACLSS